MVERFTATMLDFLQPIFPFAFPILWVGGACAQLLRVKHKQGAYLRRFPPDALDTTLPKYSPWVGGYSIGYARRIGEAERTAQPDLERERRRKEVVRNFILLLLWIFGFPLVTFGIVGILTVVGLLHPH
jgi:hypothetical protein